jgi:hypothetical protein
MTRKPVTLSLGAAAILALAVLPVFAAGGAKFADWATVTSETRGFAISYPAHLFTTEGGKVSADGQVLVSRDGKAKLVIGAFLNDEGLSMLEYRTQILEQNYPTAKLDFAPIRASYFVVSGTMGDQHFYERVSFTCGGKLINSWALLYTVDSRATYDQAIDAMSGTYAPGRGAGGACQ